MAPGAHLLISWLSSVPIFKQARERRIIAIAGISPDLDGIGIIVDKLSSNQTDFYSDYHHYIGHNIFSAFVISIIAVLLAKSQRVAVFWVGILVVHAHFFCDIIGSRGPDGYQWPIFYFYPAHANLEVTWSGQWELSAWQNQVIMAALFVLSFLVLRKKRITFLEIFSQRLQERAFDMWKKYVARKS